MAHSIPVLSNERVVHFDNKATFAEALQAALSAQWVIVLPRITVVLHKSVGLELRLDSSGESIPIYATPRYWVGSFLGMQVETQGPDVAKRAKAMLSGLQASMAQERAEEENEFAKSVSTGSLLIGGASSGTLANTRAIPEELEIRQEFVESSEDEDGEPIRSGSDITTEEPGVVRVDGPSASGAAAGVVSETPLRVGSGAAFVGTPTSPGGGRPSAPDIDDDDAPFVEEPTQPGRGRPVRSPAAFSTIASQMTEISGPALLPAWGVTDDGLWAQVFGDVSGVAAAGGKALPTLEGQFVPFVLSETMSEPLYVSARLLLMPDEVPVYTLLMALALKETTCEVVLRSESGSGALSIRRGMLVGIEPIGGSWVETLQEGLLAEGLVDTGTLEETRASLVQDEPLCVALYEKGLVSLDALTQFLRGLRERLLLELLKSDFNGSYTIQAGLDQSQRRDPVRLDLVTLASNFARCELYALDSAALMRMLMPYRERFPRFRENFSFPKDAMGLSGEEMALVGRTLVGREPLGALLETEEFSSKAALALLIALHHFGFLDWLEESAASDGAASVETYLEKRLAALKSAGHFERLEVHWATPQTRLELAMRVLLNRFGPMSHLARHSSQSARLCSQIVALCQESYSALLDPEARRKHRIAKYGESKMVYAARFLARQALVLYERGTVAAAQQMLESAVDLLAEKEWVDTLARWREASPGN